MRRLINDQIDRYMWITMSAERNIMIGYYYCSLNTFLNILKNEEIYLSDPLKMNDNLEIKWYLDRLNEEKGSDEEFGSTLQRMRMRSGVDFTCEELAKHLEDKGQKSIYISCFSKSSDLLSQWRAYADDGMGVAIGFDLDMLASADNIFVREIIYADDVVQEECESTLEIVADSMPTVLSEYKAFNREEQIDIILNELIAELARFKNPAFKEEEEVRLIYCEDLKFEKILDEAGAFERPFVWKKLEHDFRTVGANNITEFVKLKYESSCIKDICIGPKCLLSEEDVKNIFQSLIGTAPTVSYSKSSYR